MRRAFIIILLSSVGLSSGCVCDAAADRAVFIIGVGVVRIHPPARGNRFEMVGVAAVIHPAFAGLAAGAMAHQSIFIDPFIP